MAVYDVQASGNAPAHAQVGDIIVTKGGNYRIVEPNTEGASYNPSSHFWSVKTQEAVVPETTPAPYQAKGTYNDQSLNPNDQTIIQALKQQYDASKAAGDTAGMNKAHADAEAIRGQYGYSGGGDGSMYVGLDRPQNSVPQTTLPTYQPQTEPVNGMMDAALESTKAALKNSYDTSKLEAEQAMAKIPGVYQAQRNATSANAEKERLAFQEYAAATGLNSGAGGQAMLALSNQLQSDLNQLNLGEANAVAEAQNQITVLTLEYQNAMAQAVADNEYQRAAALLEEFRTKAQSVVDTAKLQASLNLETAVHNQNMADSAYSKKLDYAESLAQFGNFSGYKALGYSDDLIAQMTAVWKAANPDLAYAA